MIWETGFPHRPLQDFHGIPAHQRGWEKVSDRKAQRPRSSPGMASSRTKVRSAECLGHFAQAAPSRKGRPDLLGRRTRGAPGRHPVSPCGSRTRDAWRSQKIPGEPARLSHPGRVALPEGTRRARAAPAPRTRGAPGRYPVSPRGSPTQDAWRSRKAPGEPARLLRPGRVALPEGVPSHIKTTSSKGTAQG